MTGIPDRLGVDPRAVRAAAALAGLATMLIEVTSPRLFQPYFGGSVFVWTNLIAVVLVALATGYALGARLADRDGAARVLAVMLLIAGSIAAVSPLGFPLIARFLLPSPASLSGASDALSHYEFASFLAAAIVFGVPFVICGAASPILVRLATDRGLTPARGAGLVLVWGTAGSFVGTLLPTYVLIPHFGTRATLAGAGSLLVANALLLFGARGAKSLRTVAAVIVLAAVSIAARGAPLRDALDGETIVGETESAYQYIRMTRDDPKAPVAVRINEGLLEYHSVALDANGTSGGRYYDTLALVPRFFPGERKLSAAILGAGAGTLSAELETLWPGRFTSIDDVEIDPAMSRLSDQIGLPKRRVTRTIVADGRRYITAVDRRFDVIYLDAYARQTDIPFHMATREFFLMLRERITDDGLLAMNVSVGTIDHPVFQALVASLRAAGFPEIDYRPVSGFPSLVLLARKTAGAWSECVPAPAALEAVDRYAKKFGAPAPRTDRSPLTDDFAPVETLIADGSRHAR